MMEKKKPNSIAKQDTKGHSDSRDQLDALGVEDKERETDHAERGRRH